ncbi:divergent PAP2 family protein [Cohnella sp. WQ 127256]|uniref:divergent PAP2 family protein n=1 Tax=Cohnella sp. WQ 127256 TaxID=2938790 RepID=UPI002118720F|nr:divergent PAP2 family protein [Cohnella sp. WQ 127256]
MMYLLAPLLGWLVSGTLKFLINSLRYGKEARSRIGNGGFPSTHTTIITTVTFLIGFREGFDNPIFALGIAVCFIVIIDALGLRRAVGKHAEFLNQIGQVGIVGVQPRPLRESMGHTRMEVVGGICVGSSVAWVMSMIII